LANALLLTNKVQQARYILEDTIREQQNRLHKDHVHIADTLKTIGLMTGIESGYDKSLEVRQEALRIYEKTLPENHPKRINAMISLAGSYEALGKFHVALDYLYRALYMQERYLPDEHSSRAVTLRSLGVMHEALDQGDIAFDYYIRAYSVWMLLYPDGHNYTAFCLNRIGEVYCVRKQFPEALQCQIQALEMRKKLFKNGTPQPYSSLGRTYLDMGDNVKAIEILHLACGYWAAKTTDPSNKYLNAIESLLATAYSHNGEFDKAQELFERVLSLQKNAHPEGNPDIGYTLHHMASNLVRMSEYDRAMQYYKESLNTLLNFFSENHCEVIMVQEKMATLETLIKKMQQN
jgi:tetratricopeptide (TPR) repeat protein